MFKKAVRVEVLMIIKGELTKIVILYLDEIYMILTVHDSDNK